jgi:hypothetical protein
VLSNGAWLHSFGSTSVEFLERGISDHSLAFISVARFVSYGPKPFKSFNF